MHREWDTVAEQMVSSSTPALRIAVLHYQPSGDEMDPVVDHICAALRALGHTTITVAVHDRVFDLLTAIESSKADLVFNVCETFANDVRLEVNVAALMEMARIKFTGSGTAGLLLAQDKILTKQLLEYHEVNTPHFLTFDDAFEAFGRLAFPLIVKPSRADASLGIGKHSVVRDWTELTRRVREIRKEFNDEALAEEFIDGREVYVGVIGPSARPEILPIVELDWGAWDPTQPRISDREVKFGVDTATSPRLEIAKNISANLQARIERSALLAYRALRVQDYARVDFRISDKTGEPFVLEVNPNPYLENQSELAMGALERGLDYTQLIGCIVDSAAIRYGLKVRPEKVVAEEVPPRLPRATAPRSKEASSN